MTSRRSAGVFVLGLLALLTNTPRVRAADIPEPVKIEIDGTAFAVQIGGPVPVTEFEIEEFVDNVYIAHNSLAGRHFTDNARVTFSDGRVIDYEAVETIILQAIDPYDPSTKYTDGKYVYTSDDIHLRIFPKGDVTFVTCYDKNGQVGWGRKFIIMKEVK